MTPFVPISGCSLLLKQARQQESKQQDPWEKIVAAS